MSKRNIKQNTISQEPYLVCEAIRSELEDAKAENVVTINLSGKSVIADYMILATGKSHRQLGAFSSRLRNLFKLVGIKSVLFEGEENGDWILIDARDVIVHLFRPEVRSFYNLEKMWLAEMPSDNIQLTD
ncbi:MAG: ribosome silencing factor [Rhodospirillaceae bacterium]|nr:ribosome silencing factor [Alphaproteobacteria bacterium]MBR71627.1 ribosome silencing factor [Rhodospirillaceae bacterium]|tara:strand:+ start:627 stop:1016 length:390 start_codon:yes stop_codon:yes gene_type:complete